MADLELKIDLTKRALATPLSNGEPFVFGDRMRIALSFTRTPEDGTETPVTLAEMRSLRMSVGKTFEPPTGGQFSFSSTKIDLTAVAVDAVSFAASDADVKAKVAGLEWVTEVVKAAPATWVLVTNRPAAGAAPPEITVTANTLTPSAIMRARRYKESGFWRVELRLILAPLAFQDIHVRVLAPPPEVTQIQEGGSDDEEETVNEIQQIEFFAGFNSLYRIVFDGRSTKILGEQDGPAEIAAALNALWSDGKVRVTGSLPADNKDHFEFVGPVKNQALPLMTIEVVDADLGNPVVELDLNTAELQTALRAAASIEAAFEIEAELVADGEDPEDEDEDARIITLCRDTVTLVRGLIYDELAAVPHVDLIRPPEARSYKPFTTNQLLVGTQETNRSVRGNGVLRSFACDHGLATEDIISVVVIDNATGDVLVHGVAFTWKIENADTVTVDVVDGWPTPGVNAWAILISCSGPTTAFQNHTHEIAQINGLQALLDALTERVSDLEELVPSASPLARTEGADVQEITLPDFLDIWPGRIAPKLILAAMKDGNGLPRPRLLVPALHDASATNATALPADPTAVGGSVYMNNAAPEILVPGGNGIKTIAVRQNEFFGSDGVSWIALTRSGATSSYFPTGYQRELFRLPVSGAQLRAGKNLALTANLDAHTLLAQTNMKAFLAVRFGLATKVTAPGTPAENLKEIEWNATPILLHPLLLTNSPLKIPFGILIRRALAGTFTSEKQIYGHSEAGGSAPGSGVEDFVLSGLLLQFDTEDNARGYRGYLAAACTNITASIS